MSQLVVVTSHKSVGATFLDWSILYLSGMQQHYYACQKRMVSVPDNPLSSSTSNVHNAHNHLKNHPSGSAHTIQMLPDLRANGAPVQTVYPIPLHLDMCFDLLDLDLQQIRSSEIDRNKALSIWTDDYQHLLDACLDQQLNLIYIEADPDPMGYYWNIRSLERMLLSPDRPKDTTDLRLEYDDFYFKQSQTQWQDMGLTMPWDQRERLALDLRPFDTAWFPRLGLDRDYLHVNCQDLWNLAPEILQQTFDFLKLKIVESRWTSWLEIAQIWQTKQHQSLRFFHSLDHIVDATLNGWYYPLPKMELWQEAIIQHCLIYKHGCNLKTWQLEQFPNNTQALSLLLEPNIHKVSKIY